MVRVLVLGGLCGLAACKSRQDPGEQDNALSTSTTALAADHREIPEGTAGIESHDARVEYWRRQASRYELGITTEEGFIKTAYWPNRSGGIVRATRAGGPGSTTSYYLGPAGCDGSNESLALMWSHPGPFDFNWNNELSGQTAKALWRLRFESGVLRESRECALATDDADGPGYVTAGDSRVIAAKIGEIRFTAPSDLGAEVAALINDLYSADPGVRFAAVEGLGRESDVRVVPFLVYALNDDDVFIRHSSAVLLGRQKTMDAVEGLVHALEDPEPLVRTAASDSLGMITEARIEFQADWPLERRTAAVGKWREWLAQSRPGE